MGVGCGIIVHCMGLYGIQPLVIIIDDHQEIHYEHPSAKHSIFKQGKIVFRIVSVNPFPIKFNCPFPTF